MTSVKIGALVLVTLAAACSSSNLSPPTRDSATPAKDAGRDAPLAPADSGRDAQPDAQVDACAPPVTRAEVPNLHRAVANTCTPTHGSLGGPDLGAISCTTAADCTVDGGTPLPFVTCLQGHCSRDQCLTDADCGANEACGCANTGLGANVCVAASCHVDSDCGAGGYCSPSQGPCGSVMGFYCHTANDTCVDANKDCPCGFGAPECVYTPTTGTFVCGHQSCAG